MPLISPDDITRPFLRHDDDDNDNEDDADDDNEDGNVDDVDDVQTHPFLLRR